MIKIKIDGKVLEVKPKTSIIEVADKVGIDIPRFCYHKKLSVAANCRMCLVEVKNFAKPLPACATQVMEGMELKVGVFTILVTHIAVSAEKVEKVIALKNCVVLDHPVIFL